MRLVSMGMFLVGKFFLGGMILASLGVSNLSQAEEAKNPKMQHVSFFNGEYHAHVMWDTDPVAKKEATARIEWKSGKNHQAINPKGEIEFVLWMPAMDHGSSPVKMEPILKEKGKTLVGVYKVSKINFSMKGDWEVRLTLKKDANQSDTQVIKMKI